MQWKLNDEQFIARVRWWHRRRFWVGALIAAFGITMIVLAYWEFHFIRDGFQAASEKLATAGHPTTDEAVGQWLDNIKFTNGFALGFYAGITFLLAIEFISRGVALLYGPSRKDRLLLKLWDDGEKAVQSA